MLFLLFVFVFSILVRHHVVGFTVPDLEGSDHIKLRRLASKTSIYLWLKEKLEITGASILEMDSVGK